MLDKYVPKFIIKTEEWVMVICLIIITSLMCIEVVVRYVFQMSVFGFEEIAIYSMVLSIFVGAAYTTRTDSHIRIDLLNFFIKDKNKVAKIRWVVHILNLLVSIVLLYWITQLFLKGAYIVSPEVRIPLRIPQGVIAISAILMIYYYVLTLITQFNSTWRNK